jgi:CheY-like chemotaxis protein
VAYGGWFSNISPPMKKSNFNTAIQLALHNLYSIPSLECSALVGLVVKRTETRGQSAGRQLQAEIMKAIEEFRPVANTPVTSPEWRVYETLHLRFVEGLIVKELEKRLQLGGRQIRREINRAIELFSNYLWTHWGVQEDDLVELPDCDNLPDSSAESSLSRFIGNPQPQQLRSLYNSVLDILYHLKKIDPDRIEAVFPEELPYVQVDRALFRQVLLTVFDKALGERVGNRVQLTTENTPEKIVLSICAGPAAPDWESPEMRSMTGLLINSGVEISYEAVVPEQFRLSFSLPVTQVHTILIIDDDENALHLYQRFLSGKPYNLICVKEGLSAIEAAEQEHPSLIILDVLLPNIDGWEVLQTLKRNPATHPIPVIICSALYKPEIASILGAEDFLRKPLIQKVLTESLDKWLKLPI